MDINKIKDLLAETEDSNRPVSPTEIGYLLGITRQTVYKRAKAYKIDLHGKLTVEDIQKLGEQLPLSTPGKSPIDHVRDQRDEALAQLDTLKKSTNQDRQELVTSHREVVDAYHKVVQDQESVISFQRHQLDAQQQQLESVTKALEAATLALSVVNRIQAATTTASRSTRKATRSHAH